MLYNVTVIVRRDRSTGGAYSSEAPDPTSGISRALCLSCTHFCIVFFYYKDIDYGSLSLPIHIQEHPQMFTMRSHLYSRRAG